jgi:hypothetical protein
MVHGHIFDITQIIVIGSPGDIHERYQKTKRYNKNNYLPVVVDQSTQLRCF